MLSNGPRNLRKLREGPVFQWYCCVVPAILPIKMENDDDEIKKEMVTEFINFYAKNIANESKLINGALNFLKWCKENNISMGICTNKQDYLAVDLLKKINVYEYFEYVAGSNTFDYCKPDPRHLTNVIEIMQGAVSYTHLTLPTNREV